MNTTTFKGNIFIQTIGFWDETQFKWEQVFLKTVLE